MGPGVRLVRLGLAVAMCTAFGAAYAQSFVNFETPHCHPIDLSPNGATLATCNTAANRVDLWDMSSGTPVFSSGVPVGYDPVSVRWRTNTELWVVNHISDTISIVDTTTLAVSETIETLDEPCDVVFAGSTTRAFVSCSSVNFIQVFNPTTLVETGQVEIAAEDPRALSVSADGTKVYAAVFESGNGTTILFGAFTSFNALNDPTNPYAGQNPPPNTNVAAFQALIGTAGEIDWDTDWATEAPNYFTPAPSADTLGTRPPRVSLIVQDDGTGTWFDDNGVDWTEYVSGAKANVSGRFNGWTLVDRDIAIIDANNPTGVPVQYVERLMNHNMAIGVNPVTEDITVVGTDATNLIRFEPNITGTFIRVNIALVDPADIVNGKTIVDLNEEHLADAQFVQDGVNDAYHDGEVPQAERDKSIGDPRAIVWNAAGTRGYVAGMGSNNLIVVDSAGDRVTTGFALELQEGPTGLAIDDARQQLYALNRFEGSISVVDISGGGASVAATIPFFDPTPAAMKTGRVHLYGTHENSGLGQISCASCHVDGRHDRLAWDLGDPAADIKPLDLITNSGELNNDHNPLFLPVTLNDFHGMKGPMTTQTLRDIIGKEPLHWRGDRNGIEEFAAAFVGLQGGDTPLTGTPMQEFEDHLATLHFPPNEFRNLDNSLPTNLPLPRQFATGRFAGGGGLNEGDPLPNGNAQNGLTIYRRPNMDGTLSCVVCHTLPIGNSTDLFLDAGLNTHVIPPGPNGEAKLALFDADGSDDRVMKVPQTRAIFDKSGQDYTGGGEALAGFGLFHDGASPSIADFVSSNVFNVANDQEVADLVALNFAFAGGFDTTAQAGEFPITQVSLDAHAAVGKQTTFDSSSKNLVILNQLVTEADTADAFQIDLIAKSSEFDADVGQVVRGWFYDAGSNLFLSDRADEAGVTQANLLSTAAPGAEITFTGTPLGAGQRLGFDRDEDGLRDFDEVRDLYPTVPGIQNPFNPDNGDATGDDGAIGPDGIPDGQNDFDNDGTDNATEFADPAGTPIGFPTPEIDLASASITVSENAGTVTVNVALDFAPGTGNSISVDYATSNGTATAGSDYTSVSDTLTISDLDTSGSFNITIIDNNTVEPDETFTVVFSNPVGSTLAQPGLTATITIQNDDIDSDGDGISDADELAGTFGFVTDPNKRDTDGDGIGDLMEIILGTDPTDAGSVPAVSTFRTPFVD